MSRGERETGKPCFSGPVEQLSTAAFQKPAGMPVDLLLLVIIHQLEYGLLLILTFVGLTVSSYLSKFSLFIVFFLYICSAFQREAFNRTYTVSVYYKTSSVFCRHLKD